MPKKFIILCISLLVSVEGLMLFLMYKTINNNMTNSYSVGVKDNFSTNSMFAIMLEQEDGTYQESDKNTWPTGYKYNPSKSGCVDMDGNKIENSLTYDVTSNMAMVNTPDSSYCFLYFNLPVSAPGTILEKQPNLTMELLGGMYRYQGTKDEVNNNYICFGTNNKTECKSNPGKYIYRIIGITQDNRLKLIKKEALDTAYQWHKDYFDDRKWEDSDLFKRINGTYKNSSGTLEPAFIGNDTYSYMTVGNSWYNKIENHIWKYGDFGNKEYEKYDDEINENLYEAYYRVEQDFLTTIQSKVNLMYIHDYIYHVKYEDFINKNYDWTSGWLFLHNNDTSYPDNEGGLEWLSTRDNYHEYECFGAWYVLENGTTEAGIYYLSASLSIRPVFYLKPVEGFYNGDGTINNPYLLTL